MVMESFLIQPSLVPSPHCLFIVIIIITVIVFVGQTGNITCWASVLQGTVPPYYHALEDPMTEALDQHKKHDVGVSMVR